MSETRHAIYFTAAPGSALAAFGDAVLGTGPTPTLPEAWIEEPLRYGFHATLKAPFRLRDGLRAGELHQVLADLAAASCPVAIGRLRLAELGSFLALVPEDAPPALGTLAETCVRTFEPLRAPLTPADMERRRPDRLSQRQRDLLARWGYPYVFEEFRFHMTLTGPLDPDDRATAKARLAEGFAPLADDIVMLDAVSLLEQPAPSARFRLVERVPLGRLR